MKIKIVIIIIFLNFNAYSQSKLIETYWTKDSLTSISLLKNNKVSVVTYSNFSPFTEFVKRQKRKRQLGLEYDLIGYLITEAGYGAYVKIGEELSISFEDVKTEIDSISVQYLQTTKNCENVSINFFARGYDSQRFSKVNILDIHRTNNPSVNINELYSENAKLRISKGEIPMDLIINNNFKVKISRFENQNIEVFFNNYKSYGLGLVPQISNKGYKISELINFTIP